MKSVKKMLLGIAFLLISAIGAFFYSLGSIVGAIAFFAFLVTGIFFLIDGYLSVD